MKLSALPIGSVTTVVRVSGAGAFRRRLMELGLLPGTRVELVGVAPLGDPIELLVRGVSLSIRRADAAIVEVSEQEQPSSQAAPALRAASDCAQGTP